MRLTHFAATRNQLWYEENLIEEAQNRAENEIRRHGPGVNVGAS